MRVAVFAPHPDDEVLGVGGTMARLASEGHDVYVVIVTRGDPVLFAPESVALVQGEAREAHRRLGVKETLFLEGFPAALLDTVPHARLNDALGQVLTNLEPEVILVPFVGDLHQDHRLIFHSLLVAARPGTRPPGAALYAYETLSETNWHAAPYTPAFCPNTYVDITAFLADKLEAMRTFRSQLKPFPHERSLEAVEALARLRGATAGVAAAEALILLRSVIVGDAGRLRGLG
jgi:LmbE family N-acetylglucosaminyl deacetylase